jgi:hypothetical protein
MLSDDGGCLWTPSGGEGAGLAVSDIAVVDGQPSTIWALAHDCLPAGGECAAHLLLFSSDDGDTFITKKVFAGTPDYGRYAALAVPSNDNTVVYVFGETTLGDVVSYTLDNGTTWQEHSFEPTPDAQYARFLAISPADFRTLFLLRPGGDPVDVDRVVRWHAGETTLEPLLTTEPGEKVSERAATFGADPSTLYIGTFDAVGDSTRSSSLYISRDFGVTFAERIPGGPGYAGYGCLVFHGGELHACARSAFDFEVGASSDEGRNWFPELRLSDLHVATCAWEACASAVRWCVPDGLTDPSLESCGWPDGGTTPDAGAAPDVGAASGVDAAACGCEIYRPSSGAPGCFLVSVILIGLLRSRRTAVRVRPPAANPCRLAVNPEALRAMNGDDAAPCSSGHVGF